VAKDIDRFFDQRERDVRILTQADVLDVLEGDDIQAIVQYATEIIEETPYLDDIDIIGLDGRIIASSGEQNELGQLIRRQLPELAPIFDRVLTAQQGQVFVSSILQLDNGPGLAFMAPITNESNDAVIKMLLVEINLDLIAQIVSDFDESVVGSKYVYLVDNSGQIIVSADPNVELLDLLPDLSVNPGLLDNFVQQGAVGSLLYRDSFGDEVVAGYADMGEFGVNQAMDWSIITIAPVEDILVPVYVFQNILLLTTIVLGLAAMIFMGISVHRITTTVSEYAEAIRKVAFGDRKLFYEDWAMMMGNIELLEAELPANLSQGNSIKKLKSAVDRASSLTHRLLAFSRQQPLLPKPLHISTVFDEVNELLLRTFDESIALAISIAPGIWWTKVDASQLDHCLINLALNARDAMPEGGKLLIEAKNRTIAATEMGEESVESVESELFDRQPGDYLEILVRDNGCGITAEDQLQVFEPFYTTKEVGKGSGLGLSMVHGFIAQSQGHIKITSEPGRGTSIYLYLPRLRDVPLEMVSKQTNLVSSRGTERILVVEDESQLREIGVRVLQNQGYTVFEARDGTEAIELLTSTSAIDLLFTDIVLPGSMNGVEIGKRALVLQPGIKVLFTSGYTQHAFDFDQGFDEVVLLDKPYRSAELTQAIRVLLDKKICESTRLAM